MRKLLLLLNLLWLLASCTPQPQPIEYGSDMCHFCKMSIVDAQHAAQLVTTKAKVFNFDAIECMLNFSKQKKEDTYAFQMVNNYTVPKDLVNAAESYFLISEKLPSPMGANLTAFGTEKEAQEMLNLKGGKIYNWTELQSHVAAGFNPTQK